MKLSKHLFCISILTLIIALGFPPPASGHASAEETPIVFENVTDALKLRPHLKEWELAHAGAWGDVTGNGYPDLYIGAYADRPVYGKQDAPIPNMLFLNEKDMFTLSPDEGIRFDRERARASMALFVDLDNSGKLDLLVGTHGAGPDTRLYRNRWPDTFENVSPEWPRRLHMRNATAIDLDQDGMLDLLFFDGAYRGNQQGVMALRNLGDFKFEDVTGQYGLPTEAAPTLGSAIGDINNNGRLDIFLAHSNRMFVTDDEGVYHEYRPGYFRRHEFSGWPCGAVFADFTGNGLLDMVFTVHGQPAQIFFYVNRGIGEDGMPVMEHVTEQAGLDLDFTRATRGLTIQGAHLAAADMDNNGRRDILLSMIHVDDEGKLQPYVLRNIGTVDGIPRFTAPPTESLMGYFATGPVADFDRDGRVDVFFANWHNQLQSHLFRNITEAGNYLTVKVKGKAPNLNRMGIGATVRLFEEGMAGDMEHFISRADITLGNGYSCGEEALAHFGLGAAERCDVQVSWQGRLKTLNGVEANQLLEITFEDEEEVKNLITGYHEEWKHWTSALNEDEAELPEKGMRWDLNKPEYDGSPHTPEWARVPVPERFRPFQGKNGLPHWANSYQNPGSTCGGAVAGIDLYHANFYIVYRPETADFIYNEYTPADAGYKKGTLPRFEQLVKKYTEPGMTDTEKAIALLKKALPAEFRHSGTPPYYGSRIPPDRALMDEDLLASGGGWCNEQARVFIRLCQVAGMQGRIVHLGGQSHTTAEFYADGQWVLVDVSYYAVSRDERGNLLSAAEGHDRGTGQLGWARSLQRSVSRSLKMSAEEANSDPEQWENRRKSLYNRFVSENSVLERAANDRFYFSVINTPLPSAE